MNILYALNSLEIGGAEKITVDTIFGMKARGHCVSVAAPHGYYEKILQENGVKVYNLDFNPQKKSVGKFLSLFFSVFKIVKENDIEIIHTTHRWPNFVCYFIAHISKKCLIWTDHNILYGKRHLTLYKDAIISVSATNRDYLVKYFNIPKWKIEVIYNGIRPLVASNSDEIEKFRTSLGLNGKDVLICNIGRAVEQKGQIYLIRAMDTILKAKKNIHCLIVGGGPLIADLKKEAVCKGIENNVHLIGEVENVSPAISASKLIVLPSLWEGFPLVILESFSLGKPVVASDVGGVRDIVSEGKNGYLVKPKDVENLAEVILFALSEQNNLDKLGENAKELVIKEFGISKMLSKIEHVYEKVLHKQ